MNILQEIAASTRARVAAKKQALPLEQLMAEVAAGRTTIQTDNVGGITDNATGKIPPDPVHVFPFERALRSDDIAFICEVKKASPSKGVIAQEFPYLDIAKAYASAGAAAISVLTEPAYFLGDDHYLSEIAAAVPTPLLRKDFVVDSYMIYEAKSFGASAVLLICALLDEKTLTTYIQIADSLGLSALIEAHDENEVTMALAAGARIVGVNNRDLRTFQVDLSVSERLRKLVPPDVLFIAESGIREPADVARLRAVGVDAVLVGETLMRSAGTGGIKEALNRLRGE
ncbi:MAG: indole-3-glycerol phosphate synthase TrpC [Oscillospiraceae bacterium]|nr:indole-3-glycerol phosphate synthase TrpC [Oscillospiraceae bacterium]